ncbi:MAG: hypothetical protein GY754_00315 [bacterium]|nr:hypothetical protein [bacterium]
MKLEFNKTAIFYKIHLPYKALSGDSNFIEFCSNLKDFPSLDKSINIKGLFLSGDYFFKRINFSEAGDVTPEEIKKINSITPIMDNDIFPYSLKDNTITATISVGEKSPEEITKHLPEIEHYFDMLLKNIGAEKSKREIEIHINGGFRDPLYRDILKEAVPRFVEGKYSFETLFNNSSKTGEVNLPAEFSDLPGEIRELVDVIILKNSLRLTENKNIFVLKQVTRSDLGVILFSDRADWFCLTLQKFKDADLFEPKIEANPYEKLPHLGFIPAECT